MYALYSLITNICCEYSLAFYILYVINMVRLRIIMRLIRVITKLPNSEQSYKGKVKTHKYINRQNQSTTGKL